MAVVIRADPLRPETWAQRGSRAGRRATPETVGITERALGVLVALREAEHALPGQALGLVVGPGGSISLVLDLPGARDRVFTRDDVPILFVEAELGSRLAGRVLDHAGEPGQERFTLHRVQPVEALPPRSSRRP